MKIIERFAECLKEAKFPPELEANENVLSKSQESILFEDIIQKHHMILNDCI
jgi:hypothetical protein